ncbi:T6SS phospholipase effector Tle1-like catalytic domain-containing protein [Jannaschia marina]|uniref:T6SS phospholipase effector Tle1-like catalytic domain-containing protein n=1 Tax=Jannaschia marina TaxID=2741674 RepID=UPI0015C93A29|nr:DUF2235 domain-containing protein [Jannaschia marina]
MAEARDPITARADAAIAESGLSGDVMSVAATCPKTALEIGVFFDGTFNNAVNAGIGGDEGSYANAKSNVALLSDRYRSGAEHDIVNENGTGVCRKFFASYVPGIGTTDGGDDSIIGGALGMGATGVEAIVATEALRLGRIIATLSPGIEPEEIILDVFGFSRGAAAARYFVNAFRQGWIDYNPVFGTRQRGYVPEDRNIRIRFVGIFDTVASIGLGMVEYNYGANIHLATRQADRIFHITADNEYRINFRLNDNLPGGGDRLPMPGAHGDVGGGYRDPGDTVPVAGSQTYEHFFRADAEAHRDMLVGRDEPTAAEAAPWIAEGFIRADQTDALQRRMGPIISRSMPGPMGMPTQVHSFEITRVLHRPWVQLGLSRVAMAAMHRQAVATDVPFLDLPTGGEYAIPPALQPVAQRIIAGEHVTGADARFVVNNFTHVSANPDSIGMSGQDDRTRRVYPNRPGRAI